MTRARAGPTALRAVTAQQRGLGACEGLLQHALRGQLLQGAAPLFATLHFGVALEQGGQHLCLHGTRRYPLWPTGGSFFATELSDSPS
jgi:hypothetical protein